MGFTLTSAGRKLLQCPPVARLEERLYQIYGERPDLIEVDREGGGLRVHGFVAALAETGPTRGPQNVFVNRRVVKDRTIAHAIFDAYSVASNRERSPEVHLFIEMPPDRVDVNVHPTKAEVRFREQSLVHEVVRRAVADALGRGYVPELQLRPSDLAAGQRPFTPSIPGILAGGIYTSRWVPAERSHQVRSGAPDARPLMAPSCTDLHQRSACAPSSRSVSSATPSSSRSMTRGSASSISTWRTSGCCSSGSWSG